VIVSKSGNSDREDFSQKCQKGKFLLTEID